MDNKKMKIKNVVQILEKGLLGQPDLVPAFRRKTVLDNQSVLTEMISMVDLSSNDLIKEALTYPDIRETFLLQLNANHVQIDSRQAALIAEIFTRVIRKHLLEETKKAVFHHEIEILPNQITTTKQI